MIPRKLKSFLVILLILCQIDLSGFARAETGSPHFSEVSSPHHARLAEQALSASPFFRTLLTHAPNFWGTHHRLNRWFGRSNLNSQNFWLFVFRTVSGGLLVLTTTAAAGDGTGVVLALASATIVLVLTQLIPESLFPRVALDVSVGEILRGAAGSVFFRNGQTFSSEPEDENKRRRADSALAGTSIQRRIEFAPFFDPDELADRLTSLIRTDSRVEIHERSRLMSRLSRILDYFPTISIPAFFPYLHQQDQAHRLDLVDEYIFRGAYQEVFSEERLDQLYRILFPRNYSSVDRMGLLQIKLDVLRQAQALQPQTSLSDSSGISVSKNSRTYSLEDVQRSFPGQYRIDSNGGLNARPLTARSLVAWKKGGKLGPGRTLIRHIIPGQVGDRFRVANEELAIRYPPRLVGWDAAFHSFKDLNHGVMVAVFEADQLERWVKGDLTISPIVVYAMSPRYSEVRKADPFMLDLQALREGRSIVMRPSGSPWRYIRARASVKGLSGGRRAWVELHADAIGIKNLQLSLDYSLRTAQSVRHGEMMVVAIVQDPNHGPIVQIFREEDFVPAHPEKSKNPCATYAWVENVKSWMPVDLATLDIVAWSSGRQNLRGLGRRKELRLTDGRPRVLFQFKNKVITFWLSPEHIRQFDLRKKPVYVEIRSDRDVGSIAKLYVEQGGTRHDLSTYVMLNSRCVPTDLDRLSIIRFVRRERNVSGEWVSPRVFRSHEPIHTTAPELLWQVGGERISLRGLAKLVKVQKGPVYPIFIPRFDPVFGTRFDVHDQRAYDQDSNRMPDIVLIRHPKRHSLVPLEQAQKTLFVAKDYWVFQSVAKAIGLRYLIAPGAMLDRPLVSFITALVRREFGRAVKQRKIPGLLRAWAENEINRSSKQVYANGCFRNAA